MCVSALLPTYSGADPRYIDDLLSTLLTTLNTLTRGARRPATGAVFLLNNVAHLRTSLLAAPRVPIDDLLGPRAQELHER